jgi:hypothetical protein
MTPMDQTGGPAHVLPHASRVEADDGLILQKHESPNLQL